MFAGTNICTLKNWLCLAWMDCVPDCGSINLAGGSYIYYQSI